jgi:hypothetical protein
MYANIDQGTMSHWVCGASATSVQVKEKVVASTTAEQSPIIQDGKPTGSAGSVGPAGSAGAVMIPSASLQSASASAVSTGGAAMQTAGVVVGIAGGLVGAFAVFL